MNTNKVIELLREADPEGTTEVCVDNVAISFIGREPAYLDGKLQVLEYDENDRCIGARVTAKGDKIVISPRGILDLAYDEREVPIDLTELGEHERQWWVKAIEDVRNRHKAISYDIDLQQFTQHILDRLMMLGYGGDIKRAKMSIKHYFDSEVEQEYLPADLRSCWFNWSEHDRKEVWYLRAFNVNLEEEGFKITKADDPNRKVPWVVTDHVFLRSSTMPRTLFCGMTFVVYAKDDDQGIGWDMKGCDGSKKDCQTFSNYIPASDERPAGRKFEFRCHQAGEYKFEINHPSGHVATIKLKVMNPGDLDWTKERVTLHLG